ncbi:MAG: nucleotidyltransferase domain-containing protein [Gomphosphaeria aponina SAG 52.96 = DSM 107014]|uniref:Nucleotidyltransferase domain-containing protein n=1 Tax=Gomphosphaeria aponina SAG 52.96 = DSM 107014 TaxID=1521640 RepID=A0A941JN76_9CHRO|nr:nucleotidyltransferase domain-containing protein [Gomphosphaeria aponina SAG 52.96 = DSM 107014]
MKRKEIEERSLLIALTGSHAYGTNVPDSDQDYRGVFVANREYYLGCKNIEQKDSWDLNNPEEITGKFSFLDHNPDFCLYELKKLFYLIEKNNPNLVELFWFDREYYLHLTPLGEKLISHREKFLSSRLKYSAAGYAESQIKRMERHRRWLLNPPQKRPTPQDFGFNRSDYLPLTKSQVNSFIEFLYVLVRDCIEYLEPVEKFRELILGDIDYKAILKNYPMTDEIYGKVQKITNASDEFMHHLHMTRMYQSAIQDWENYQQWLKKRNPDRAALEAKCGYDAKHGSHCLRLLRMAKEAVSEGVLKPHRHKVGDANYLLAVRQGEVSYEELMGEADKLFQEVKGVKSVLSERVERNFLNDLCMEIVAEMGF